MSDVDNATYSIPGFGRAWELQNRWDEIGTAGLEAYSGWITEKRMTPSYIGPPWSRSIPVSGAATQRRS